LNALTIRMAPVELGGLSSLFLRALGMTLLLGVMLLLDACNSNSNTAPAVSLVFISVGSPDGAMAAGMTQQMTATGVYSDGSKQDLSSSVTWSSSKPAVASVSATGVATARVAGSTTISVSDNEISGSTTLTVTSAMLVSIGITPAISSLANGTQQQFIATGVYSDNCAYDLTTAVTWTSSLPTVASASNTAGSNGLVAALAVGATSIGASFLGVTAPGITLTVTPAFLVSIGLTPANATLPVGLQQSFTATGTYSDHTTQIITNSVTWSSASPAVASISNTTGSQGQATGVNTGSSVISAALNGVTSAPVTVTVTTATVISIAVSPASPGVALGLSQQFTATGTYSDLSTQTLTAAVIWHSSNVSVAPISNAIGATGLATTLQSGSTAITATLGSVTSSPVTFTVTAATLVSLAVTPASYNIMLGATKPFTATGTYTDNSTQNLTTAVAWSSDNTAVTLSNAPGSNGLATGATVGTAHITAAQGGMTSPAAVVNVAVFQESILYSFVGPITDGAFPYAGLIQGSDGNFYGTTFSGGASAPGVTSVGSVFEITPAGVETVMYSFTNTVQNPANFSDGEYPFGGVIQGSDGDFYGTTRDGGATNSGTVFKVTPAGVGTVLYSFAGGADGANPLGGVIQSSDGNFYGTTRAGGATNTGTVFKITPAGVETVLYSFVGGTDGANPAARLIQGSDGNFYGTTVFGGATNSGTVFKMTPAGSETVLYSFAGGTDGVNPYGGVTQGSDGNFYGTTGNGGTTNTGTVFRITPAGSETVLYSFAGGTDGATPYAGVIQGSDGNFYGTTSDGGAAGVGTLFDITPAGVETVLYSFAGGTDGATPCAGVIQGSDGSFYGATEYGGGVNDYGTVFKYGP
jgi:uncharacterized repeat protein (TIGR03803 family)